MKKFKLASTPAKPSRNLLSRDGATETKNPATHGRRKAHLQPGFDLGDCKPQNPEQFLTFDAPEQKKQTHGRRANIILPAKLSPAQQ